MDAEKVFLKYVSAYDRSNGKIELKIVHTLAVAELMDQLTGRLQLTGHQQYVAHVCALFHDIGRFEQVRRYDTFMDQVSVDHARLGVEILRESAMLEELEELTAEDRERVLTAIANHNRFVIEPGLDEETLLQCRLIRDADKCDIFRVFACEDMVETMGETIRQVEQETITDAVYESILAHRCVRREERRTGLDVWMGFLGFLFDLYFDESIAILMKEQYYRRPFEQAHFRDVATARRVEDVLAETETYIRTRLQHC